MQTRTICNTRFSPTTPVVAREPLNIPLHVHCLLFYVPLVLGHKHYSVFLYALLRPFEPHFSNGAPVDLLNFNLSFYGGKTQWTDLFPFAVCWFCLALHNLQSVKRYGQNNKMVSLFNDGCHIHTYITFRRCRKSAKKKK